MRSYKLLSNNSGKLPDSDFWEFGWVKTNNQCSLSFDQVLWLHSHGEKEAMKRDSQYDRIGPDYMAGQKVFFSRQEDHGRRFIAAHLPSLKGLSLLDIGCGHGPDIPLYEQAGASVWAVDESEYMVLEARKLISDPDRVCVASTQSLPFDDGSFDVITGRFSFHYVTNLDEAYRECSRVLKPGGSLILVVQHPMADFLMKKNKRIGTSENISCSLYEGRVTVKFPSHDLAEWLSPLFLKAFDLCGFDEYAEEKDLWPGMLPPTAMCIAARKR